MGRIRYYIHLYLEKKRWRKDNVHNSTGMGKEFNRRLVSVGKATYGVLDVINFSDRYRLDIGSFCSIAPGVTFVVCGEHRTDTISTYPFKVMYGYTDYEASSKGDIIVKDDVWIGLNATILSGVTIGQGAVISAGAVVTKDVPPYAIVGGNPARIIKMRFDDKMINDLLKIDFGTWDEEIVRNYIDVLYLPAGEGLDKFRNQ